MIQYLMKIFSLHINGFRKPSKTCQYGQIRESIEDLLKANKPRCFGSYSIGNYTMNMPPFSASISGCLCDTSLWEQRFYVYVHPFI